MRPDGARLVPAPDANAPRRPAPLIQHLGQSPVHHLDLAEAADHDVRRLQVAVDHAPRVGIGHRLADLLEDRQEPRPVLGRVLAGLQEGRQRAALDQLHGDEQPAVGEPSQLVDRDDPRMLELAADLGLLDEAAHHLGPVAMLLQQDLDGQVAAEVDVAPLEDGPHAAPGDLAQELVAAPTRRRPARASPRNRAGRASRRRPARRGAARGAPVRSIRSAIPAFPGPGKDRSHSSGRAASRGGRHLRVLPAAPGLARPRSNPKPSRHLGHRPPSPPSCRSAPHREHVAMSGIPRSSVPPDPARGPPGAYRNHRGLLPPQPRSPPRPPPRSSAERMGRPHEGRIDPSFARRCRGFVRTGSSPAPRSGRNPPAPTPRAGVRRLCRQGRCYCRISPRMNPQRCRPRYYFEKLRKIFSPRLDGRLVEKMASNGGTPFKDLQSWTILLVGRVRRKNQGTGGVTSYDARKQSRAGFRDDREPEMIGPGRCLALVVDCC